MSIDPQQLPAAATLASQEPAAFLFSLHLTARCFFENNSQNTPCTTKTMAKSARSSVKKINNRKLKARVFGPAEDARTERLSRKLLELASQPKAARAEMEVEPQTGMQQPGHHSCFPRLTRCTDAKATDSEAKEAQHADGALLSLSIPIPSSLASNPQNVESHAMPPTPPPTPPCLFNEAFPSPTHNADNKKEAGELLFYHMLGVSSDIAGIDVDGHLMLAFGKEMRGGIE